MRPVKEFQTKLEKLIADAKASPMKQSRAWLHANHHPKRGSIEMYIRVGNRYVQGSYAPCITLASLEATPTGTGLFTALLELTEAVAEANGLGLYIENVLTKRFAEFWRKRGYVEEDHSDGMALCFYKIISLSPRLNHKEKVLHNEDYHCI